MKIHRLGVKPLLYIYILLSRSFLIFFHCRLFPIVDCGALFFFFYVLDFPFPSPCLLIPFQNLIFWTVSICVATYLLDNLFYYDIFYFFIFSFPSVTKLLSLTLGTLSTFSYPLFSIFLISFYIV